MNKERSTNGGNVVGNGPESVFEISGVIYRVN